MRFRSLLSHLLIAILAVGLGFAGPISAAEEGAAVVHRLLQPLIDRPSEEIPDSLRSEFAGAQGRATVDGRPALSLHVRTEAGEDELKRLGAVVRSSSPGWATIDILPERLQELAHHPRVHSISLPYKLKPVLETSVPNTGADHLRTESGGVFTGLTGDGVIIGVIDTGIDWSHPNFKDPNTGLTRILGVWDQAPNVFCNSNDIDNNNCSQMDIHGHGSHVTGIAAGNGAAPNGGGSAYEMAGMAPEADIVVVKTDFYSNSIILGIDYILQIAAQQNKEVVINLSLGGHGGSHDGTSAMESHIDSVLSGSTGRAVVIAAGNERMDRIHAERKTFHQLSVIGPDLEVQPFPLVSNPTPNNYNWVQVLGYYPGGEDLLMHLVTPSGDYLTQPLGSGNNACSSLTTASGWVILCNTSTPVYAPGTSANEVEIFVSNWDWDNNVPLSGFGFGNWHIDISGMNVPSGSSEIDFWVRSNTADPNDAPYFTSYVDGEETLGMPGTSEQAIVVGAHTTKPCFGSFNSQMQRSMIADFSSWGPTRDGRRKPELTAPGMLVESVATGGGYIPNGGTSMAAPHVAGAVALLLEQNGNLDVPGIKALLNNNTSQSYFSSTVSSPGGWNPVYGYGLMDLGFLGTDPYETNDQLRHAREVLSGEIIQGYIGDDLDADYYRVHGMAPGDVLRADLSNLPFNYDLWLYSVSQIGITCNNNGPIPFLEASSTNGSTTSELAWTTSSWWYADFMAVTSGGLGQSSGTAPYTLKGVVNRPETSAPNDSISTAQQLPEFYKFGVTGEWSTISDQDYYCFPVKQNQTINASVLTAQGGPSVRLHRSGFGSVTGASGWVTYNVPAGQGGTYCAQVYQPSLLVPPPPIGYGLLLDVN